MLDDPDLDHDQNRDMFLIIRIVYTSNLPDYI